MTTINDLLVTLQEVPEHKRDLPIYVCDDEQADNFPVTSVSLYDQAEGYGEGNPLGIHFVSGEHTAERPQTEEQAMAIISDLRARFDMVGTEFVKADIEEHVRTALADLPEDVVNLLTPAYAQAVVSSYYWPGLRDIIIARGNEHLGDAVLEVCGLPSSTPFGNESGVCVTSRDSEGRSLREVVLRDRIDSLVSEVEQAKQVLGAVAVTIHDVHTEGAPQQLSENILTVWKA